MYRLSVLIFITLLSHSAFPFFAFAKSTYYKSFQSFPQSNSIGVNNIVDQEIPDCADPTGLVKEMTLESVIYKAPIKFSIYLPPCFNENSATRYPVIYLLHGQTYDHEQWLHLGLSEEADALIDSGQISPVIIIMPNDPGWNQPDDSPFGRMLVEEMVPYVDRTFPTRADRQYRAIGGLSRGASWAVHLGLTHWDLFTRIGAHSLPIFVNDTNNIPVWLSTIPYQSIPQIYIDMGNQDPELNTARYFEMLLSSRFIPHEWHMFTGAHEESYWAAHIKKYLLWYACGWTVLLYN